MFDQPNFWLVLSNLILYLTLYLLYSKAKRFPYAIAKEQHLFGLFLIMVFLEFSFWGNDWFHMYNFYTYLQSGADTHMEDVYVWISQNLAPNYFVFRLVVWGGSLLLLIIMIEFLPIRKHLAYFMFVSFGLLWFSYARVSAAMIMMFCGLALLYNKKRKLFIIKILALALIIGSFYFHKTAIFGIVIITLSILWQEINGRYIILPVLAVVVALFLNLDYSVEYFMNLDVESTTPLDRSITSGQNYLEYDVLDRSITYYVLKALEQIPYYVLTIICIFLNKKKYALFPPQIQVFVKVLILTVTVSFMLSFIQELNLQTITERLMRFAFLPTIIIMSYIWKKKHLKKISRYLILFGLTSSMVSILYSLYVHL